jgi:hypothetical protein
MGVRVPGTDPPVSTRTGPRSEVKLATSSERFNQRVKTNIKYWRASDSLRSSASFVREMNCLGEFAGLAAQEVFLEYGIKQVWANGEADCLVASLARELDAYALSQGSAFFLSISL